MSTPCALTVEVGALRQEVDSGHATVQLHAQKRSRVCRLRGGHVGNKHPLPLALPDPCMQGAAEKASLHQRAEKHIVLASSSKRSMEALRTSFVPWPSTNHHAATVEQAVSADCAVAELGNAHLPPREGGVRETLCNLIRHGQSPPPRVPPAFQEAPSACSDFLGVVHSRLRTASLASGSQELAFAVICCQASHQQGSTAMPVYALVCQVVHNEKVSLPAHSQLLRRLIGF